MCEGTTGGTISTGIRRGGLGVVSGALGETGGGVTAGTESGPKDCPRPRGTGFRRGVRAGATRLAPARAWWSAGGGRSRLVATTVMAPEASREPEAGEPGRASGCGCAGVRAGAGLPLLSSREAAIVTPTPDDRECSHRHGGGGLAPAAGDRLGGRGLASGKADQAESPRDARPELARRLGDGQRAVVERGLAQREQRRAAIGTPRDVRLELCAPLGGQHAVGVGRQVGQPAPAGAGDARRAQLGEQVQPGRADEARHVLLVDAEGGRDLVVGPPLQIAQGQDGALLRGEPLVGNADLALRRAARAERLATALVGQNARRGIQVGRHVERLVPLLRKVREGARERQLDERGRRLRPARQPMAEAIDAAFVRRIEQLERTGVAALHAAHQCPGLAQFALARLVPGDRHRLANPSGIPRKGRLRLAHSRRASGPSFVVPCARGCAPRPRRHADHRRRHNGRRARRPAGRALGRVHPRARGRTRLRSRQRRRLAVRRPRRHLAGAVAPARLRGRRRLSRPPRRVPARRDDRRLLEPQRLRRDLGQRTRLRRARRRRPRRLVARRACAVAAGGERADARPHPGGGRARAVPSRRAGLARRLGVPRVHDLNDLDADIGVAPSPVNIAGGVRWNAALAYLDPVRERASLRICGDAPGRAPARPRRPGARRRRAARGRARHRRGGACDRVRGRLRLPRAAAALRHRARRRPAGARHPRRRRPARRRREPARSSGHRARLRGHARAPCRLQRVRSKRLVRPHRGRDREDALAALRARGLRPARLPGRRPRARRHGVLAPRSRA